MFKVVITFVLYGFCQACFAKQVEVTVTSPDGKGVANAVVYLLATTPSATVGTQAMAIMDQIDTQFSPHILAVQKDTQVSFPNADSVKHHVYSFSPAKTFELQLYRGLLADPLLFSKTGAVALGCNVHDWMLGYIYVVDTPYFAKTDARGRVTIEVPTGEYTLQTWHPRIQDKPETLVSNLTVTKDSMASITLSLNLLPSLNKFEGPSDDFSDYE